MLNSFKNSLTELNIPFEEIYFNEKDKRRFTEAIFNCVFLSFNSNEKLQNCLIYPVSEKLNKELIIKNLKIQHYNYVRNDFYQRSISKFYLANKIKKNENIYVHFQKKNSLIKINTSFLFKSSEVISAEISSIRKYKTTLVEIYPETYKKNIHKLDKCILGYSVGNPEFKTEKIISMIKYIEKRFNKCVILVGDSLYRNTIKIKSDSDLSDSEALKLGIQLGNDIEKNLNNLLKNSSTDFEIIKCSNLCNESNYFKYYDSFFQLYKTNKQFQNSVFYFCNKFLARNFQKTNRNFELSFSYLIEELSLIACLLEKGYELMLYPGDLECFKDLANNKIYGVPPIFDSFINGRIQNRKK